MKTASYWKNQANLGSNLVFRDKDLSPSVGASIWESCPQLAALDPAVAFTYYEDFLTLPVDTNGDPNVGWKWTGDHSNYAGISAGGAGGILTLACGDTDNDESYMQLGQDGTEEGFVITSSSGKAVWFETRVKAEQHADMGVFIGLAEAGCSTGNFLTDNTGAVADKDFVGFNILTATPAAWNVTWKKNGQTVQAVTSAATNADDWHKFAFMFDGASTVTFYVDGAAVSTVATTTATTFPSGEELQPILAIKTGEGVAKSIKVDYIKVVQLR